MAQTHSRAVIVSIGDELVLGQSLDTNSKWLSERLLDRGAAVIRHVTVADDVEAIASEIGRAAADAELVVATGGLGPTMDDLTRAALARAMGRELVEDAEALAQVRAWFESRGRVMPEPNRVQALRPAGAVCLENTAGTAPGLRGAVGGADVFCLPGPPREMRPMFERFVLPALRPAREVRTRLVRTFGLGESRVAELLGDLMRRDRNPLVGTTASAGVVTVRMRWELDSAEHLHGSPAAKAALDEADRLVRAALGAAVFTPEGGDGEQELATVVLHLLKARRERFAVAESCTGGLIGALVTAVPGSSAAFAGGWITYTNAMKAAEVGVPREMFTEARAGAPGAVSREVARAMAEGALLRAAHELGGTSGVDHALAVTGIAGPEGGSEAKPVGTVWICRASREGSMDCRRFLFGGGRESVREWAAATALGMLRLKLAGEDLKLHSEQERWGE
jgi:nicotinamide-nucleotide amidase